MEGDEIAGLCHRLALEIIQGLEGLPSLGSSTLPVTNTQNADIIPAINPLNMDSFSVPSHLNMDLRSMLNPKVDNPSEPGLLIVCRSSTVGALLGMWFYCREWKRCQTQLGYY